MLQFGMDLSKVIRPDGLFCEETQMKLKLDESGHVVVVEGKPVYVHDDGKEIPFDAAQAIGKISQLNGENKAHREKAEGYAAQLKGFEGLDSTAARDALDKLSKLDQKKLIDAGEVDKVRLEVSKVFEEKLSVSEAARKKADEALVKEMIGGNFARSAFIGEKLAIPVDFVQAQFGRNFGIEDGRVVATDSSGNKVYSRERPGELASFDEALAILVENYPQKAMILKGSGQSGSGANGGGGDAGGSKKIKRSEWTQKAASEQMAFVKGGGVLVD